MACRRNISCGRTFSEHLQNRVPRHEMDQKKDD